MRLKNAFLGDVYSQWRYGFYWVYMIVCATYIVILKAVPISVKPQITAILIFSDPAAMGLFFMGAIILLEKSQHVLNAVAVSPLQYRDYILSKVLSLALIATIVATAIALSAKTVNLPQALLGTLASSIIFTLIGIIAAANTTSLNQFVVVSIGIDIVCFIPPILPLVRPDFTLPALFPLDAAMRLIYGSSNNSWLDIGINVMVILVLYLICYRQVKKMFSQVGGVKL